MPDKAEQDGLIRSFMFASLCAPGKEEHNITLDLLLPPSLVRLRCFCSFYSVRDGDDFDESNDGDMMTLMVVTM